jgi:hypothetical protein
LDAVDQTSVASVLIRRSRPQPYPRQARQHLVAEQWEFIQIVDERDADQSADRGGATAAVGAPTRQ